MHQRYNFTHKALSINIWADAGETNMLLWIVCKQVTSIGSRICQTHGRSISDQSLWPSAPTNTQAQVVIEPVHRITSTMRSCSTLFQPRKIGRLNCWFGCDVAIDLNLPILCDDLPSSAAPCCKVRTNGFRTSSPNHCARRWHRMQGYL